MFQRSVLRSCEGPLGVQCDDLILPAEAPKLLKLGKNRAAHLLKQWKTNFIRDHGNKGQETLV